MTKVTQFM